MTRLFSIVLTLMAFVSILGCDHSKQENENATLDQEIFPGGATTVSISPRPSFQLPAKNIASDLKPLFHAGKALANQPWVKAPTVTFARDGLGPIYNERTCLMCHINGGKGFIPDNNKRPLTGTLVRISKVADEQYKFDNKLGVAPHPAYGDQIQSQSTSLAHQLRHSQPHLKHDVAPEAYVHVNWQFSIFTYPDGTEVQLRQPKLDFKYLGYGPLNKGGEDNTLIGLRVAPPIHGMGLIELIPQKDIDLWIDENDENKDGISGRTNLVWDAETETMMSGRFGLKANKASLTHTVAGAFTNDVGITNSVVPNQPCTAAQLACQNAIHGNDDNGMDENGKPKPKVELPDSLLKLVVDFNRNIGPVARRNLKSPEVISGREIFYDTGCQSCHRPNYTTGMSDEFPHLSNQSIWPYTDLLIHDMGPALSDNRPDFLATGSEWRTPPLWGLGVSKEVNGSTALLHDGRANTIEEAILWHGGEAEQVKQRFIQLPKNKRNQLIQFVNSL